MTGSYYLVIMTCSDHFSMSLYEHMFLFLLGKYLGVELPGHKISIGLALLEIAKLSSKMAVPFYIPNNNT